MTIASMPSGSSGASCARIDWNMRADDSKAQLWRMNLHYFEYLPDVGAEGGTK